jgi:hypothetical protein
MSLPPDLPFATALRRYYADQPGRSPAQLCIKRDQRQAQQMRHGGVKRVGPAEQMVGRQLSAYPGPANGVVSISGNENCDPDAGINDHLEITPHVAHGLKR